MINRINTITWTIRPEGMQDGMRYVVVPSYKFDSRDGTTWKVYLKRNTGTDEIIKGIEESQLHTMMEMIDNNISIEVVKAYIEL